MRELNQIICAHDPDELCSGAMTGQLFQAVRCETEPVSLLKIKDFYPAMRYGHSLRTGESAGKRGHFISALQRILRAYQPPHFIQSGRTLCKSSTMQMPVMSRVERSSHDADTPPVAVMRAGG